MFRSNIDIWVGRLLCLVAVLVCALFAFIMLFMLRDSIPALQTIRWRLVTDRSWHPHEIETTGTFGLLPMIVGTLLVTGGSVAIAAPAGIASALFCRFYAPYRVGIIYRRLVELLAGIPSVVYGFWGLVVLVPLIARLHPPGPSLLAGTFIVGLMILPTIMLVVDTSLSAIPRPYLEGAAALGLGRWTTIGQIVIPAARSGIVTGILLGATRAVGETMAVVMICGNVVRVPSSLFDPIRTLTANISLEMGYALGQHRSALFASGLVLLLLCVACITTTEWIGRFRRRDGAF